MLVAQLSFKILVRGWAVTGYGASERFKALIQGDVQVAIWHLDWLHRLGFSDGVAGGGGCGRKRAGKRVKREADFDAHGNEGRGVRVTGKMKLREWEREAEREEEDQAQ